MNKVPQVIVNRIKAKYPIPKRYNTPAIHDIKDLARAKREGALYGYTLLLSETSPLTEQEIIDEVEREYPMFKIDGILPDNLLNTLRSTQQEAMLKGIELGKRMEKWISVEERLPDTDRWVLVATDDKSWFVPRCYSDGSWYEYGSSCTQQHYTHWCEIPERKVTPPNK